MNEEQEVEATPFGGEHTEESHSEEGHSELGHSEEVHAEGELMLGSSPEVTVAEEHSHSGLDGLWEVMFGWEHVIAEVFWNTVWLTGAFALGRVIAFRKIHKYIDDQHGITHDDDHDHDKKS